MSEDDPSTEELRLEQTRREQAESDLADGAGLPEDELTHGRRAEKAGYLAEKLKEQAESNER